MAKGKENDVYPHVSYVSIDGAPPVSWNNLSADKKIELNKKMMNRVSENLSRYINSHPEELDKI